MFRLGAACSVPSGFPGLYDGFTCSTPGVPDIKSLQDIGLLIGNVVRILIALSGSLAIIMLLVASIYYITATGDPARVKRAREIIIQTVTGLILIVLSYALVTFVTGNF